MVVCVYVTTLCRPAGEHESDDVFVLDRGVVYVAHGLPERKSPCLSRDEVGY